MQVPFTRPYITGNELVYIKDVIENRRPMSGDGKYTKMACTLIESCFRARKALLTTSCSSALDLATLLLRLKPGDEVIVPSYTFVSTVNPIVIVGARPVFAEIEEGTMNIDPRDIRKRITPRTRAIYPVHYAGVSCDMDQILEIASDHGLRVVEDAAQGVNAKYKGRYLGTLGDLGCYSFHDTKNYSCGEGGALLINGDDRELKDRAEIMREKGTNRSQFFRGEVDKYTWVDIGSSYLPGDILAAYLYAQLEKLDEIQEMRMHIYNAYDAALKPYEKEGVIRLPVVPDYASHNAHMYYVLFRSGEARDDVIARLKAKDVHSVFHYVPLHSSPMGLAMGYRAEDLPLTQSVSERLLRLPMYAGMTEDELAFTIEALKETIEQVVY